MISMPTPLTRRHFAAAVAAPALATGAQTPTSTAADDAAAARQDTRSSAEQLAKVPLKTTDEPAFSFKA